jgi:hypothetical protein
LEEVKLGCEVAVRAVNLLLAPGFVVAAGALHLLLSALAWGWSLLGSKATVGIESQPKTDFTASLIVAG